MAGERALARSGSFRVTQRRSPCLRTSIRALIDWPQLLGEIDIHLQKALGVGFALGIVLQTLGAAAPQRVVEDEGERQDVRQLGALDRAGADLTEVLFHALGR